MNRSTASFQETETSPWRPPTEPHGTANLSWIARFGWLLLAAWVAVLVTWGVLRPEPYAHGWRLVVELAFLGRLVNVADGIAQGFSKSYLLIQSGFQDILLLLVAYPPLVAICEGSARNTFVGRRLERIRQTAERHKSRVEPLGALGLWIFVFFPFWSTGALVGGVIGYLLGMRTWLVFSSVFAGHALSVLSLVYFFDVVASWTGGLSTGLVRFIPWIVLGVLLACALVARRLQRAESDR